MGICTKRILITTCIVQMVTTLERQIFDFLGFMWTPILINFFQIIFIIFGLFGSFQYQYKYLLSYCIWNVLALAWNIFIVCFYLEVGSLDKNSDILNLGTGSVSWWEVNGYGCRPYYSQNITNEDIYRPVRPEYVTGCFLDYSTVEIIHASIQILLSISGILTGLCFSRIIWNDIKLSETASNRPSSVIGTNTRKPVKKASLYSIEFSSEHDCNGNESDTLDSDLNIPMSYLQNAKPMTPRRVKRRSVMTRGHPPQSHHHNNTIRRHRNSDHGGGISGSGGVSTLSRNHHSANSQHRSSQRHRQNPVTQLIDQQQLRSVSSLSSASWGRNGHTNPTYQQSSIQSLNDQSDYDLYNNRPPSARSNYSNFHGMRHGVLSQPMNSSSPAGNNQCEATAQAPIKRDRQRQSLRTMAFLNSGPPAYTLQGNQLDSETTI